KSIEYFKQSIQGDPSYAEAHEGLAEAYSILPDYDVMPAEDSYPRAKAEALKALDLDPALGEAHATLAVVKEELDWDWPGAGQEFERALQLDPASPLMNAESGAVLYWARKYDAAIEQLRKAIEMEARFPYAHSWLGFAYEQKGMRQEAIAEFQKAVELSGGSPFFRAALAYGKGLAGQDTEAKRIFAELRRLSASGRYVSPYDLALIHIGLGEKKQALESLEQVVAAHDTGSDLLKCEPALDSLRG